ncbi:MAG: FAD-dependent oxidoreductase [Burkholderiales bacterium]|nr:FAD-dependent oxidoreductase [Burkholderiales bacterium]
MESHTVHRLRLLTPMRIGKLEIPNRIMMPAMHLNYHRDGCYADETLIAFYKERARGRAGLISIGGFAVDPAGAGVFKSLLLGLWSDAFVPDLKRLVAAMRAEHPEGKIACQLYHTGRVSPSKLTGLQPVGASDVQSRFNPEPVHVASTEEVREIERKYVEAAVRAVEIGFDCIDVFCGVGHLLNQFLSPATNNRTDEYGGSLENRARIAKNIVIGIRQRLPNVPILARLAGHDLLPNGNTHVEAAKIAAVLEHAGVDAFNVTGGWHESRIPQITGEVPTGAYVWLARTVKDAVRVPVAASNRINDPVVAERILQEGLADFISMGRPLLADPDLPRKLIERRAGDINHCIACNVCLDTAWYGPTRCLVNPRAGREAELELRPMLRPQRIAVAGGGPGGMMAAKIAAARGLEVTLFEQNESLGGVAAIGDIAPGKKEYRWLYDDLARQISSNPRIHVRLGMRATVENLMAERPGAIIVATGGNPEIPAIPGIQQSPIPVMHAHDVLAGKGAAIGKDIVIVGGGPTACETALYLREQGGLDAETVKFLLVHRLMDPEEIRRRAMIGHPERNVTIVQRSGKLAKDLNKSVRWTLLNAIEHAGVAIHLNSSIASIGENTVVVSAAEGTIRTIPCDTLVVAAGITPENTLYRDLVRLTTVPVQLIGDAVNARQATEALLEGFVAANSI